MIILANKTELLAMEIGDKVAETLGVSVVGAEFKKEDGKQILRIFIDKDGGVGINDCEEFSRVFSDEIDKDDPIETEYLLEVSSPGVERKLKTEREYLHYRGTLVDVKLFSQVNGKKEFTGIIKSYEDGKISFECEKEMLTINTKDAAYIKLHFEF
ncbi:MAG: ribosome maturation factor RimP [Clostridia bacterium]|nr:ribosome maturation factor RimP [Clostridia bacterium]